MKSWVSAGLDADAFWRKTPREVSLILEGRADVLEREHNERMSMAWHIVALNRSKKLPKLETMFGRRKKRRAQTWQDQKAIVKMFNAAFGGDVKKAT